MASGDQGSQESNFENWQRQNQARADDQEHRARAVIARLCGALRRLGVERIEIGYNGSGDEGFVDQFEVEPDIEPGIPTAYRAVIEDAALALLPGGWDLNEGSLGTVAIDVDDGEADVDHTWRPANDLGVIDDEDA